jgi:hypothetical protein
LRNVFQNITIVKKGYENIGSRIDDMTKIIDQLNIKIMDFNIFDAMKQKNTEGGN